ncbi:MAG: ABC transporter ATP-binding protein [Lactobacillales bacterium]|jgi:oligopeptide transport system ATP-binding protein|nr:ABC transporter ATP-binding protein [Lactobacillales bacterium]
MNKEKVLRVENISVEFQVRGRTFQAIRNISVDLYKGEVLALVGESGSGKSVFMKILTGMLEDNGQVSNGQVLYDNKILTQIQTDKEWAEIRGKEIATIFQDPMTSLDPLMTIGKQISEVIIKHQGKTKSEAKRIAIDLMKRVGIPHAKARFDDYPFQYSGGMRQRIVIAIALACKPKILICDEPTTALDVTIQAQILALIKELQQEFKFTIFFITHDLGIVASIADKVAVMYSGEIVEYGEVQEIFYDPKHPYTWSLLSSLPQLSRKEEELFSISGSPPSLFTEIKGDAFAARNPYAMEIDFEEAPPKFEVTPTHWAKTWLLDERAPELEKPEVIQNIHEKLKNLLRFKVEYHCAKLEAHKGGREW